MDNLISLCWITMEMLSYFLFFDLFLKKRQWTKGIYAVLFAGLVGLYLLADCYIGKIPVLFFSLPLYLLLSLAGYSGSGQRRIVSVLMCALLLCIVDTFVIYGWSTVQGITMEDFYTMHYTYCAAGTISKAVGLFIAWIMRLLWPRKPGERIPTHWLILALVFPVTSLIMLFMVYSSFQSDADLSAKALGFTIAIAFANIGILYLITHLEKHEREARRMALLNQQMEIQTQSILALEKSHRAQRTASHEFYHRLNTIGTLLENGHSDHALEYVHQLQGMQTTRIFSVRSQHPIVDAVLNLKYQTAKESNIDMQVKVNDLSGIEIPTDALVVMLSNLLDNAIEACQSCPGEKIIRFSMILEDDIFLTIDNTTTPVEFVNGDLLSKKKNKDNHGYGLENTKHILEDLHAEYAIHYQDGWFRFVVEIPIA